MNYQGLEIATYIYTYTWTKDERSLCKLEQRSLFGMDFESSNLESSVIIDPSRSPFIKERIGVIYESECLEEMVEKVKGLCFTESTFKVVFVQDGDRSKEEKVGFPERREIERKVGFHIKGDPDLFNPDLLLGIMHVNERWIFGTYVKNEAIWLRHQKKPQGYSTALSTRVARAVVNIAIPDPAGIKAIDPCCGIGTVLVEAKSMGINIVGSDLNRLVIPGAKENLAHFGFECEVELRDVRDVSEKYDAAIIDLPYNLCSVITPEEQLGMLQSARRFSKRLVVVTIEPIDSVIANAGFQIVDRCVAKKGTFVREVIVCE